jgi:hypothetical protein
LAILQFVLVCHTLSVFAQSVFAGQFLSGIDRPVKFHEWTGWAVLAISAIQIVVVAMLMRSGKSSLWLFFGSILLFLAEGLQMGMGYGRFLDVHIPLGVIVFGAVTTQTISAFLKPTRTGGPAK